MQSFKAFMDGFSVVKFQPSANLSDLWAIRTAVKEKQERAYKELLATQIREFKKLTQRRNTDA